MTTLREAAGLVPYLTPGEFWAALAVLAGWSVWRVRGEAVYAGRWLVWARRYRTWRKATHRTG